jgi:subtilisin
MAQAEPDPKEQQEGPKKEQEEQKEQQELRPAWSLRAGQVNEISVPVEWPGEITREWAWGGSTGKGVSVCILDSGIDAGHELVGRLDRAVAVSLDSEGKPVIADDTEGDLCGHGTACAGVVRALAPDCDLVSVRVLGAGFTGSGDILLAGLRWAVEQGFDVINMSLSTTKRQFAGILHELTDAAYFRRSVLVASAHNMPVESYPWKFSSVISVGSHEESDPLTFYYNPDPPVEFFARGVDVEVAWVGGAKIRCTGNSFATPHISGICALVLGKHPDLTPFQLKSVLYLTSSNVGDAK